MGVVVRHDGELDPDDEFAQGHSTWMGRLASVDPYDVLPCFCIAGGTPVTSPPSDAEVFGNWKNSARDDGRFPTTVEAVHVVFLRSSKTPVRPLLLTTDEEQAHQYVEHVDHVEHVEQAHQYVEHVEHVDQYVEQAAPAADDIQSTVIWTAPVVVRWDVATLDAGFEDCN